MESDFVLLYDCFLGNVLIFVSRVTARRRSGGGEMSRRGGQDSTSEAQQK